MDAIINLGIGFVLSWVANNIPTIAEKLSKNKLIEDKVKAYFGNAVDKWNVSLEEKEIVKKDEAIFFQRLKDYITHPEKGRHPKESELFKIWAELLMGDADCSAFIISLKEDLLLAENQKGILRVEDILNDLMQQQKEEFERVNAKLNILIDRGLCRCEKFWERWSVYDDGKKQLPYSIILGNRNEAKIAIQGACKTPKRVIIEAGSHKEAMAFAVAVILDAKIETKNVFVVESADAYQTLISPEKRCIIITDLCENHSLAIRNGHSVIWCVSTQDMVPQDKIKLGQIDRDICINSLIEAGHSDAEAQRMAQDTAFDINQLWRQLSITTNAPLWETSDNLRVLIPLTLLGQWNESYSNDMEMVTAITGLSLADCEHYLHTLSIASESPIQKIGSVWRIKSASGLLERYYDNITEDIIDAFVVCLKWILEDDDPDAVAKMKAEELQYWKDKHLFSGEFREGIFQGLTLLSLMNEKKNHSNGKLDTIISEQLKTFDLTRYLSNKHNLLWMAEANPDLFLRYIENDIKAGALVLNEIFKIRKTEYDICDTKIEYSELLWCLECIAWHEDYLPRVTNILFSLCAYENNSNWSNRPENSLYEIYRFFIPQTFTSFDNRMDILKKMALTYPQFVRNLCYKILKGLADPILNHHPHFRWRWAERIEPTPVSIPYPSKRDLDKVVELLLNLSTWTETEICELIELSMEQYVGAYCPQIVAEIDKHISIFKGNEKVVECLRKNILQYKTFPNAKWAISKERLTKYEELLTQVESEDFIARNKHYFEDIYLDITEIGAKDEDYTIQHQKIKEFRADIIRQIIDKDGWDGVCKLVHEAKSAESVADGVSEWGNDTYIEPIYREYVTGNMSPAFVARYFSNLYYKNGLEKYLQYVDITRTINSSQIGIILYAPSFQRTLATLAEQISNVISEEYWQKVFVWQYNEEDIQYITKNLRQAKRHHNLLLFLSRKDVLQIISNEEKIDSLLEMLKSEDGSKSLMRESYHTAEILKTISLPSAGDRRNGLLLMEFMMHNHLKHYFHQGENHFDRELNTSPELMMSIVDLMFLPDEEYRQDFTTEEEKQKAEQWGRIGFDFWFHYHDVPCQKDSGDIDEDGLRAYITQLQELAKEHHRTSVISLVVGRILGNLPETEDYPTEFMCHMVEELDDDTIDSEISCALSNRRGMTSRSPFEGGTIERKHIETFTNYKKRAMQRNSPRLVKVFENEINSFSYRAEREDQEAQMNSLTR